MEGPLTLDRLTLWLALLETPLATLAAEHSSFYRLLYPQLRLFYEAAGSPYGAADEDMWSWWQKRAVTERERWLEAHRRNCNGRPSATQN